MLLKTVIELESEGSRREHLVNAGLRQLVPSIDVSGSALVAISRIVRYLSNYGRLTYEREALGIFLDYIKTFVGVENRNILDTLLIKYHMLTPTVPSPDVSKWQGKETAATVFEKIIGENTLRPIAFLTRGLQTARSVAYVGVLTGTQRWSGTGFLIAADLLLTNYHVIPSADLVPNALFRFNYEENFEGEAQKPYEYRARSNGNFHASEVLDYAIMQLEGEPGNKWGWLAS